jgi:RecB family endonuclease NucS
MKSDKSLVEFLKRVERGRKFEEWERSHWKDGINSGAEFEVFTQLKGKRGRVDIRLGLDEDGQIVIVEIKATDWDNIKADRVRKTALQHTRQIWRYIEAHLTLLDVTPAIVYPSPPKIPGRKEQVEEILNERGIQCVWRNEYLA